MKRSQYSSRTMEKFAYNSCMCISLIIYTVLAFRARIDRVLGLSSKCELQNEDQKNKKMWGTKQRKIK